MTNNRLHRTFQVPSVVVRTVGGGASRRPTADGERAAGLPADRALQPDVALAAREGLC